jgi:hypothetical protein
MLAAVGPEHEDEAHVLCAECRAKHGGWCIDELGPQGRSMCPLDLLAMSVTGSDRPATG